MISSLGALSEWLLIAVLAVVGVAMWLSFLAVLAAVSVKRALRGEAQPYDIEEDAQ